MKRRPPQPTHDVQRLIAGKRVSIAMWSGPRNISTAMMRAWGSRPDTCVCDEPLYAHYLWKTSATHHPGYHATISGHETDWRKVVHWLAQKPPYGKMVFYQKHMAHHLLPEIDLDWIDALTNCFLIRSPREMIASLAQFISNPNLEETGLPQQVALYRRLTSRQTRRPLVLDASDVVDNPRRILGLMCKTWNLPFYEEMLRWEAGPRDTDGAWAPYWYEKFYRTTGFSRLSTSAVELSHKQRQLRKECEPLYQELYESRLR